jgi:branched-chain amino acid transport system permease protein
MTRRDLTIGLVILAILIAMPFIWPTRYILGQFTLFFIWATVVTQWNLVFGVAGIFSLAQMALFAIGGYVTGMLGLYFGWPLWIGMFFGGFAAVLFSLLIGLACLRLRGAYVALLTLAIAQTMYLLIITDTECFFMDGVTCRNFTGGTRGLTKYGDFGFREMLGRQHFAYGNYFLALSVLAAATAFSIFIIRSPIGLAFRALRDSPVYAVSRGISRFKYQMLVFAASAFFTGLAGAVFAGYFRVMGANTLYLSLLLFLLSMMVVGGLGSAWGPLLGVATLMLVDEGLKESVEFRNIGLGLILIAFVVIWPKGIAGAIETAWQRWRPPHKRNVESTVPEQNPGSSD